MRLRRLLCTFVFTALTCLAASVVSAQDPTGSIEGTVTDKTGGVIPGARITATHLESGFTKDMVAGPDGFYRFTLMRIGPYSVTVEAQQFGTVVQQPVQVNVGQAVRLNVQLELSAVNETVTVSGGAQIVDTSTNALGRVVTGRELVDLPLNGRNFTQLGLLQTGVAPLTAGVATAGGIAAAGPGVRGQRHAAGAEHLSGGRRAEHEPHGRRLCAEDPGRCDCRVSHPHAERAARIRRHRRRDDQRRDASAEQPAARQRLRVRAQRQLRRAQFLLRRSRAAEAAPVRRDGGRPAAQRDRSSSSATTRASATARA